MAKERTISPGQWKAAKLLDEISCLLSELWDLPLVEAERRKYMKLTKNIIDNKYLHKNRLRKIPPDPDDQVCPAGGTHERFREGVKVEKPSYGEELTVNTGGSEESGKKKKQPADRKESSEKISLASVDLFVKGMDILRFTTDISEEKKRAILEKIAKLAELHIQMIASEL